MFAIMLELVIGQLVCLFIGRSQRSEFRLMIIYDVQTHLSLWLVGFRVAWNSFLTIELESFVCPLGAVILSVKVDCFAKVIPALRVIVWVAFVISECRTR